MEYLRYTLFKYIIAMAYQNSSKVITIDCKVLLQYLKGFEGF